MGTNDRPLVSVVLPTYDRPVFLPDAIRTVAEQTYDRIELVVVDDHSPVSPRDIVEAPHDGLRNTMFIRHEENQGASAARNTGIDAAHGELIAFLDDDDAWEPTKIERQVDVFGNADASVGAVYTGIRTVDTNGSVINVRHVDEKGDLTKDFLCGFTPPFSSVVVRRVVAAAAGPFDKGLPSWNDRDWLLRVAQNSEFEVIDDPLVVGRRGDEHTNLSGDFTTKQEISYPRVLEKFRRIAAEYGWLFERKSVAHLTFRLGYAALTNGKHGEARRLFVAALLGWPFEPEFFLYAGVAATGNRGYRTIRRVKRAVENRVGSSG